MNLEYKSLINGIMAYWSEVKEAVSYNITLYINDQAISTRVNHRTELYCTFTGLAAIDGITERPICEIIKLLRKPIGGHYSAVGSFYSGDDYYIIVEAEDRNGKIIETSEKIKCKIREL